MICTSGVDLSNKENIIELANQAEICQHWSRAAILWRRAGELVDAESCETICQYLAESNLEKFTTKT